jgi:hypothetical protein
MGHGDDAGAGSSTGEEEIGALQVLPILCEAYSARDLEILPTAPLQRIFWILISPELLGTDMEGQGQVGGKAVKQIVFLG